MSSLNRILLIIGLSALMTTWVPKASQAEIIKDFKQQSGLAEDFGLRRAVYLGRLFNGVSAGPYRRMDSMYAVVTIAQANNVQLYAGDGNSNFDSALAQGRMFDTGIRITNRTQNNTEVIFVPGDPSNTPPFKIDVPAGVAIHDSLAANSRLDFWVVGTTNSGFTIPSTVAGNAANFFIQFDRSTAVPEPSSMLLAGAALCISAYRLRIKKRSSAS